MGFPCAGDMMKRLWMINRYLRQYNGQKRLGMPDEFDQDIIRERYTSEAPPPSGTLCTFCMPRACAPVGMDDLLHFIRKFV